MCYTHRVPHNGRKDPQRDGKFAGAALTPDQIAEINARRSPSTALSTHPSCPGKKRDGSGDTCEQVAGYGTSHVGYGYCKYHGGTSRSGIKAAARLKGRDIIETQREKSVPFGGDRHALEDFSPEMALLEEVRRSVAMVRWLEDRIGAWEVADDEGGVSGGLGGLPALIDETSRGATTFTDQREWLLLYREERGHAARVAKLAIDAGIQERFVQIAEEQGKVLATAVRAVLDALNLSPEQHRLVPQVVPNILRSVASRQPLELTAAPQ